jgi:hypothetical protein
MNHREFMPAYASEAVLRTHGHAAVPVRVKFQHEPRYMRLFADPKRLPDAFARSEGGHSARRASNIGP